MLQANLIDGTGSAAIGAEACRILAVRGKTSGDLPEVVLVVGVDVFALISLYWHVAEDIEESGRLNVVKLFEEVAVALLLAAGDLLALDLAGKGVVHL